MNDQRFSSAPEYRRVRMNRSPEPQPFDATDVMDIDINNILFQRAKEIAIQNNIPIDKVAKVFNDTCSICFENLNCHDAPPKSIKIICGHTFCLDCIRLNSMYMTKCPNCRTEGPTLELESGIVNDLMIPQVDVTVVPRSIGRLSSVISRANLQRSGGFNYGHQTNLIPPNIVLPPQERVVIEDNNSMEDLSYKLIHNSDKSRSVLRCISKSQSDGADVFFNLDCSGSMSGVFRNLSESVEKCTQKMGNSRISVSLFDNNSYHVIPLKNFNISSAGISTILNDANTGGGTLLGKSLEHLIRIIKASGYDPENPRDTSQIKVCIITDGDTQDWEYSQENYKILQELVSHFGGRIKFCSFGPNTNLHQIQEIIKNAYEEDFDQCSSEEDLDRVLQESSANVLATDIKISLGDNGSTFLTGNSFGNNTKDISEICSGQFMELLIDKTPEIVTISYTRIDGEEISLEVTSEEDTENIVDKISRAKDLKIKLAGYMTHLNENMGNRNVARSIIRNLNDIKSEIREEFLGRNYYLEIKDLFDAIEAESNSRIDSNCRNDSHHIFASQVARTRSCERRGGGEVMSQR